MLVYNLEQGTEAWLKLRLGLPTTSSFGKIITPTGKKSGQFTAYCNECIAQLLTGESEPMFKSEAMVRGSTLEPFAVDYYAHHTQTKPKEVGFITSDCGRIGCSPDRLIGKDGLLEVKCPLQTKHTINLISGEIDSQYIPQVQGQMLVTERNWCDWMSYYPDLPASIVRVERDEEYLVTLNELLEEFVDEMDTKIAVLKDKGVVFAAQVGLTNKVNH